MTAFARHSYASLEEFEREEINPHKKAGWCLDDLYEDATFRGNSDEEQQDEVEELDFSRW